MITLNKLKPAKGRLLISEPFLNEPYFKRSVIILVEHNDEGSMGFILNKPIEVNIKGSIPDFSEYKGSLFLGGPVKRDQLFFIHTLGDKINGSVQILDNLFLGGDLAQLKKMIKAKEIKESEFRFFAGYAGWGPDQLKNELKTKSWFVGSAQVAQIMDENTNRLWGNILKTMGKEYAILSNFPENPSLN